MKTTSKMKTTLKMKLTSKMKWPQKWRRPQNKDDIKMKMTSKKIMTSTIKKTSKTSNPPKVQACMKKRLREDKPAWRQLALCRTTHGAGHIPPCGIFFIKSFFLGASYFCDRGKKVNSNLKTEVWIGLDDKNFWEVQVMNFC